jgi:hypothetical protein
VVKREMVDDLVTPLAGQITTIAGMGIGLGILAGTASNVMQSQRKMMGVREEPMGRHEMREHHVHKDWKHQKKMKKYHPQSARSPETIRHPYKYPNIHKPIKW